MSDALDADDAKLVTLARASRARTGAAEGAAVRDTMGRTYSAATVTLPSLDMSALRLAVAMAVSSGADGLEAAVVVTDQAALSEADLTCVGDFGGAGVTVHRADASGALVETRTP